MEILELLKTRRSYRKFDQSRPIPESIVREIMQAQQYAASAMNKQCLRYLVVSNSELVEEIFPLTRWAGYLSYEDGQPKDGEHPTLFIVVLSDTVSKHPWIGTDAGIAIDCMTLAAWNKGVGSCIIANVKHDKLRELLSIGEQLDIHSVIGFGYPTHKSEIVEIDMDESIKYYMNDDGDYRVPKYKVTNIADFRK